ncbi:hypothetical protein DMB66_04655 [Actinoplanes sp. ATCC 53533]|uniref:hypothetical protein n=1 Tax=Actinoplanes sp. ATCC 53533 TaxID=1288362 RepID=UPI000F79CAD8|nr:hypothetical protein [Actinoplanes sp. ATCC 53533]RSM72680.1 hypothetical protein DMB66_04655 [Actinoplanes sp. ATCC 53533]
MTDPTPIRSRAGLKELSLGLRRKKMPCDEAMIAIIEREIEQYRSREQTQLPPHDVEEVLPLLGWLIYEASWRALQAIPNGFRQRGGELLRIATENTGYIVRCANAARGMPWPEYAPRALGAIRAQALAASKVDTEESYVEAQTLHLEGRTRHAQILAYHRKRADDERDLHLRALDEVLSQLALAETGTACRTAERVIDRWAEEFAGTDEAADQQRQDAQTQLVFQQLTDGADIGGEALKALDRVHRLHGFKDEPDEEGLALRAWFINPGIMTARALLLLLAFSPEMERLGYFPMGEDKTWQQSRERLRDRFIEAYDYIERPVLNAEGGTVPPRDDLKLAIVQIRLGAGLLMPGLRLPTRQTFASCLSHEVLDDAAIEGLSAWLTEPVPEQRSRYRGIGAAIMPNFVNGVEACRAGFGGEPGYRAWRARWFVLDKYGSESARRGAAERVLGRPVSVERPV